MEDEAANFIALSFVDVMANGMGSLLVLFILTTIIREVSVPSDPPPVAGESSKGLGAQPVLRNPQIIFVRSASKKKLPLQLPVPPDSWKCEPVLPHGTSLSAGHDYAAIYSPTPLEGHTITLTGLHPGVEVVISVPDSASGLTVQKSSRVGVDGTLRIWTINLPGGGMP